MDAENGAKRKKVRIYSIHIACVLCTARPAINLSSGSQINAWERNYIYEADDAKRAKLLEERGGDWSSGFCQQWRQLPSRCSAE